MDFEFKVIGFLKQNTAAFADNLSRKDVLDRSIIMPFFNIIENNNVAFQKKYYSQKNWGYIDYGDKDDIKLCKETLSTLSKKYNLLYDLIVE